MDIPTTDSVHHKNVPASPPDPARQKPRDFPSIYEMIAQSRERATQRRDQFKPSTPKRYGDVPMEAYARLARARTQAETAAAAGFARRGIARLKAALGQDEGNSAQIRAAIGQLQKAVLRSGRKKNELGREALAQLRRKQTAARKQEREAMRQQQELRRRQAMRQTREGAYLSEAAISNRMAAQIDQARAELALTTQTQAVGQSTVPIPPGAIPQSYQADVSAPPDAPSFTAQA